MQIFVFQTIAALSGTTCSRAMFEGTAAACVGLELLGSGLQLQMIGLRLLMAGLACSMAMAAHRFGFCFFCSKKSAVNFSLIIVLLVPAVQMVLELIMVHLQLLAAGIWLLVM